MHVPVPEVRCVAVAVAGHVRMMDALPILHSLVVNDEDRTRRLAALALGSLGDDSSVRFLVASTQRGPRSPSPWRPSPRSGDHDGRGDRLRGFALSDDPAIGMAATDVIAHPAPGSAGAPRTPGRRPDNVIVTAAFQRCLLATGTDVPRPTPMGGGLMLHSAVTTSGLIDGLREVVATLASSSGR